MNVVVDQRAEQVVRRRNGVNVAGKVQVDVLHRDDLCIPATGGAALNAENRAERRLPQRQHGLPAGRRQCVRQTDGRRRFAFPRRRRIDRRHQDQLAVRPVFQPRKRRLGKFRFIFSIRFKFVFQESGRRGNLRNRRHNCLSGDGKIALHEYHVLLSSKSFSLFAEQFYYSRIRPLFQPFAHCARLRCGCGADAARRFFKVIFLFSFCPYRPFILCFLNCRRCFFRIRTSSIPASATFLVVFFQVLLDITGRLL